MNKLLTTRLELAQEKYLVFSLNILDGKYLSRAAGLSGHKAAGGRWGKVKEDLSKGNKGTLQSEQG